MTREKSIAEGVRQHAAVAESIAELKRQDRWHSTRDAALQGLLAKDACSGCHNDEFIRAATVFADRAHGPLEAPKVEVKRKQLLQAIGIEDDVDCGRDPIEAANSVKHSLAETIDEVVRMQESIDLYRATIAKLEEQLHQQQQTHARQLREMGRDWPRGGFNRDPFGGMGV